MNFLSETVSKWKLRITKEKKEEITNKRYASCLFLVDTSHSMNYPKENPNIDRLNAAVEQFKNNLIAADHLYHVEMEIALFSFHGNQVDKITGFTPVEQWSPAALYAEGLTPMGKGLEEAILEVKKWKKQRKIQHQESHETWIIMLTDGRATDSIKAVQEMLKEERQKEQKDYILWIVASENADLKLCRTLTNHVLLMRNGDYQSVFRWAEQCLLQTKIDYQKLETASDLTLIER